MKVAIVGTGYVGSTTAYALAMGGIVSELVLIDIDKTKAEGEVLDINHGLPYLRPMEVKVGDFSDCAGAKIIVIAAGAAQRNKGQTRLELIEGNAKIINDIVPKIVDAEPGAILLMVSNPVDVLTYIVYKTSGLPANQVMGSGTILDSARFRYIMSQHCKIDTRNIHGYVLGEHGDTSVVSWSLTNIAGVRVEEYCSLCCDKNCNGIEKEKISKQVKSAALEIIDRKGATNFAIAMGVKRIVETILRDERSILTLSVVMNGEYGISDIALSLPVIVGAGGIEKVLELPLNTEEVEALRRSANVLKEYAKR